MNEGQQNITDNVGKMPVVNGVKGEGARRGRKGWGSAVGEISGAIAWSEMEWDRYKPVKSRMYNWMRTR